MCHTGPEIIYVGGYNAFVTQIYFEGAFWDFDVKLEQKEGRFMS